MNKKNITILGAGLVGSLLAILFRQRGYNVTVFERRADARKSNIYAGRSINMAMSHRGWNALEQAGLKNTLATIAIPMYGRQIHPVAGEQIFQAYGKNNEAIYSISRAALNIFLMNEAEKLGAIFNFNTKSNTVDLNTNIVQLQNQDGTFYHTADLLIGSDGSGSSLRHAYSVLDRTNYEHFFIGHGYKELSIPAGVNNTFTMHKEALHIWPRKNYMLIALPNPDGSFTLTLFFPFEGTPSFDSLDTDAEITAFFKAQFGDAVPLMPQFLQEYNTNPTASLITVKISKWAHQDKSLIIGDAAHAIVPFYGQGMNAGFEDATVLMQIIDKHNNTNWGDILAEYQHARIKNGNAVAQLALNNFIEMRDLVADPTFLERKQIEKELALRYPTKFLSVYEMVSFSHTPYSVALATTDAQHSLYQTIMANTTNFFEQIKNADYALQLDGWIDNYFGTYQQIVANA